MLNCDEGKFKYKKNNNEKYCLLSCSYDNEDLYIDEEAHICLKNCSINDNGNIYTYLNKCLSQCPSGYIPNENNFCIFDEAKTEIFTQMKTKDIETMISTIINTNSEMKTEFESETNINTEFDSETNNKAEIGSETNIKTEVGFETNIYTEIGSETNIKTEIGSETNIYTEIGSETNIKTDIDSKTNIKTEVGSETNIKTEIGSETNIKTEIGFEANIYTEIGSETNIKTEIGSEANNKAEPKSDIIYSSFGTEIIEYTNEFSPDYYEIIYNFIKNKTYLEVQKMPNNLTITCYSSKSDLNTLIDINSNLTYMDLKECEKKLIHENNLNEDEDLVIVGFESPNLSKDSSVNNYYYEIFTRDGKKIGSLSVFQNADIEISSPIVFSNY